jgi:hypothetical protein
MQFVGSNCDRQANHRLWCRHSDEGAVLLRSAGEARSVTVHGSDEAPDLRRAWHAARRKPAKIAQRTIPGRKPCRGLALGGVLDSRQTAGLPFCEINKATQRPQVHGCDELLNYCQPWLYDPTDRRLADPSAAIRA